MPEHLSGTATLTLGVDIGTYETKAAVVAADGRVVATAARRHQVLLQPGGRVEHDAEQVWWQGFCEVVRAVLAAPAVEAERLGGLAVSAIGPCVLAVDAQLNPLSEAILYGVDTRATAEGEELTQRLGVDTITRRCGNALTSQSAGPKILWLRRHRPEVHAAARWFLTSQSFVVARLTGEVVVDHLTASYYHPLYDLRSLEWEVSGCEDFVSLDRLPRLAWSGEQAGVVTAEAAELTGLPAGLPVAVGTADAPAEALSCGVTAPGDTMVMYGSSSFLLQVTAAPPAPGVVWAAPYLFPGTYLAAAGTSTAGTLTRWLVRLLGLPADDDSAFLRLRELAESVPPGANGLLMLPYLSGERTPLHDPGAQGVLLGLTLEHGPGALARAALEGIAHAMVAALEALADATGTVGRIQAVGGGLRNPVWVQAVTDISGVDQVLHPTAGAAVGSARLAAVMLGRSPQADQAADLPAVQVDPALRERYAVDHRRFTELYSRTRDLLTGPTSPLEVAPR